ncbi:polysaccharide deacetylase family protein [Mycolicibacterium litorale]|uniref:NodB homology domain-containing protein n=1 Tax=Mycolicibacterium litorale TaxID=758802 RepID=A0AAD1IR31_9MYCO|nr:polysaccharide deacetylase family protein [Mycolicibacterium litorale]MCV7418119.1 polysaccharide deacetylase family protein [Mycolicibacterium litorale]TDY06494.1 peptidoglycan/xylan/chitin deacetylase (PgdA/CDA1 family) [Mycolicibacterium litorale]BBY19361.1 hypothetical protein MLIT_49530 [Mycolicibacterium litorale]
MTDPSSLTSAVRRAAHRAVDGLAGGRFGSIDGVRTDQPLVALTFDDGPDPEWTPRVLETLARNATHATFFMLVQNARRHPHLVRRAVAEGHEVALHGPDHRSLAGARRRATRMVLGHAAHELRAISGAPVHYFRPPFGDLTPASFLAIRDAGLACVVWDLDSLDWRGGDERLVATEVVTRTVPGNIVLLHDGCAGEGRRDFDRAKALQLVLDGFRRRSLHSTTLSALFASGNTHRTVWFSRSHVSSPKGVPA